MKKILLSLFVALFALFAKSYAQPALMQNFESGFGTWTKTVSGGGGGWAITSGATATQLGVIPAHTNYGIVNEALLGSGQGNAPATLISPTFSLTGLTTPYLAFDQYYFQAYDPTSLDTEKAWIEISTDGGTTFSVLDTIYYNGYPSGTFNTNWVTNFINLGSITATSTCILKFVYTDMGGALIGLALDNIMVYDASKTDLALTSVTPAAGTAADYYNVGASINFSGTVTNYSNAAISSFTASYQVGSGSVVNNAITGTSVPAMGTATFNYTTPYTIPAADLYPVSMWVTATGDDNLHNDSAATSVQGVKFQPKKRPLFEEATGSWCGYCVRGIVYMDSLWKLHRSGVSIISVHDYGGYDPMAEENSSTEDYDTWSGTMISGYPSMIIDRTSTDDPQNALGDYATDSTEFGFFNIGVTATTTGSMVRATVTVEPALNLTGNYNIALVVEEDGVYGTGSLCSSGWGQHDYYGNTVECSVSNAAHSTPLYGCGYNFNDSNTVISPGSIHFPFVARYTLPSNMNTTNGISGSLPTTLTAGSVYTFSDSVAIAADWVASNLRVVAFIVDDNSSDANYKQVLNSVNTSSTPGYSYINDGVKNINAEVSSMKVFPNPTYDITHVQFELNSTSNVQFMVYDAVGRQVFSAPAEQMNAGGQQINFSTAEYPAGVYTVVVRTDNGTMTQRLSVIR